MVSDEVPFRPSRQSWFTDEQRWALLQEYDQCVERGAKSAFLRRVAVTPYSMRKWARWRDEGRLMDPATKPSTTRLGRNTLNSDERQELVRLRRDNDRLKRELEQSQTAVELLGKAAALLEGLAKSAKPEQEQEPEPSPGMPAWLSDPDTSRLPQIPSRPSRNKRG